MSTRTRAQINPNLRIEGDQTVVDLDEDVYGPQPTYLEQVEVFEATSGLLGRGWVVEVDESERSLTLVVDWANLTVPEGNRLQSAHLPSGLNFRLPPVEHDPQAV